MIDFKQCKVFSDSNTDAEEQQRKQVIALIFPQNLNIEQEALSGLHESLKQNFILSYHSEYLINYTFRNHHPDSARVYRQFLSQKCPQLYEPQMSLYYPNAIFPDLKQLGQYRGNPAQYPNRHIAPLEQAAFVELDRLFFEYGYIPHLQRFLTFFPSFLVRQRVVQKELFQKSKIDHQTTYFLGLCAASQMGCPYMINRMAIKYLSKGGKIQWIEKKRYSQKVSSVLTLNRKLARCIWELVPQDIQQIIEGGFWNINELALIIQILSFVHSLCSVTLGIGLRPQQRSSLIWTQEIQYQMKAYQQCEVETSQKSKKQLLKDVLPNLKFIIEDLKVNLPVVQPKVSPKRSFKKQQKSSQEDENMVIQPYMKQIGNQLTQQKLVARILNQYVKFLPKFQSIQKRRDNKFNQFTCVDFNFQFMAFPRLQSFNFVTQSTKKIIAFIKESQQMGLQNFGSQMIGSTKQLRKAQRYYAQNLCGFSHPYYDYKKFMTNILTMPLKFYIRLLMLSPLHIKRQVLDEINHQKGQIQLFDLGHTAILIAVAKFKLSLTLTTYYFDY